MAIHKIYDLGASPINKNALVELKVGATDKLNNGYGCQTVFKQQPLLAKSPVGVISLVGRRVGLLTVVGYSRHKPRRSGVASHVWICRCPCGQFVERTGATLLKNRPFMTDAHGTAHGDRCPDCRHMLHIQSNYNRQNYNPK